MAFIKDYSHAREWSSATRDSIEEQFSDSSN
jgi:hypothetical protein